MFRQKALPALSSLFLLILPSITMAQKSFENVAGLASIEKATPLFHSDEVLHFTLSGNLYELYRDISENNSYHPVLLQYKDADSNIVNIPIRVKTRGHFRRQKGECNMPPLLLDFPKDDSTKNTVFAHQKKLKLVVPCTGDEYVIREYLVYKLYNLISPKSFRDRLAMVTFQDSSNRKKTETHYCFLLEDEKEMAARNDCFVWKKKLLDMRNTDPDEFRKMAVFQYLIGNTDWGVAFLQNIVLITSDTLMAPYTVAYDFDQAGIVDAPYAVPHQELGIPSVLTRLYRGYCETDLHNFDSTFALFNRLKPEFYAIYDSCSLLPSKYKKFVDRFLDGFYKTINNERDIKKEFGNPCNSDTHIEIKGLKD
jgi:hypothetical protein